MSIPTATPSALLSPDALSALSTGQRQAYLNGLTPAQQQQEQAALAAYQNHINGGNTKYLQKSVNKYAICPPTSGGITSNYLTSTTLNFNFPTAGGAYLRLLEITVNIICTVTGTAPLWTAAGAWAWFSEIDIIYNGQQSRIRPYFLKVLQQTLYQEWMMTNQVSNGSETVGGTNVAGKLVSDSTITANTAAAQPVITSGVAFTSKFKFRVPLQLMRWSPVGMLPMQGQGTKGQVNIITASAIAAVNADPLTTPITVTALTSAVLGAATVQCMAIYCDGVNLESKTPLGLQLANLPTAQFIIDQTLAPLTAGTIVRQRLTTLLPHYIVCSIIIDGNQSTSFALAGNIAQIELDQDAAGQNKFFVFGPPNNTTVYDYYTGIRQIYGQDLDTGVIMWVNATQFNTVDPSDSNGTQVLNMTPGNWTDVNYGLQVNATSSVNFTPRVETYLFSRNDAGLVLG